MSWSEAENDWIRIHDIIQFVNRNYGTTYAENSRETFRKQALHRFRTAALVEDNGKTLLLLELYPQYPSKIKLQFSSEKSLLFIIFRPIS